MPRLLSLPLLVLSALLLMPADVAAASLEGSWGGSGVARYQGRTERLICRVRFSRIGSQSFEVSSSCSAGPRRYEQSGRVTRTGQNRYRGSIFNPQFNERGELHLSQRGSRLAVTVRGQRGTANLTLSRR